MSVGTPAATYATSVALALRALCAAPKAMPAFAASSHRIRVLCVPLSRQCIVSVDTATLGNGRQSCSTFTYISIFVLLFDILLRFLPSVIHSMPSLRKGGGLIARARPGRISMYELRVPKAFHGKCVLPSADFLFLFCVHITKRRETFPTAACVM